MSKGEEKIPKELPYFLQKSPKTSFKGNGEIGECKCFLRDKQVLKNINWQLNEGEKWLLRGPEMVREIYFAQFVKWR